MYLNNSRSLSHTISNIKSKIGLILSSLYSTSTLSNMNPRDNDRVLESTFLFIEILLYEKSRKFVWINSVTDNSIGFFGLPFLKQPFEYLIIALFKNGFLNLND